MVKFHSALCFVPLAEDKFSDGIKISSTSLPGGNQVDGLPPASSDVKT